MKIIFNNALISLRNIMSSHSINLRNSCPDNKKDLHKIFFIKDYYNNIC